MLWHIGNTTVRTPYRLQEALQELLGSPLNGNLSGRDQEQAFAEFLHENNIVEVARIARNEDASDVGRKWRAALSQLGFITPRLTSNLPSGVVDPKLTDYVKGIETLSGRQYEITPNGARLGQADTLAAQQECFLRALAAYQIPSVLEDRYETPPFSPLRYVLEVFSEIKARGEAEKLSFQEFALFVQTTSTAYGAGKAATEILEFRRGRDAAKGHVRAFDRARYESVAKEVDRRSETLDDYADLSFRYLKATGLFREAGRGIAISPNKAQLAELIRQQGYDPVDDAAYLSRLWQGAELPTDDIITARVVVEDLAKKLSDRGQVAAAPPATIPLPDLELIRHRFEDRLLQLDEEEFAADQANKIDEIVAWMEALATNGSVKLPDGSRLAVPKGEAPAYLEWVIWRAFLAINSLTIPPWEARNFKIDQDFLPVHCAPGGRPDMVFEFENTIIVVEVTLTSSSRQEAAEGEPVRRHVARFAENAAKKVYGLFIAIDIDSNTAHTFSAGAWYLPDDSKISLDIVPLKLDEFRLFLISGRGKLDEMPKRLRDLLMECRSVSNRDAPLWKQEITKIIHASTGAAK
jgi:hypothetical protein